MHRKVILCACAALLLLYSFVVPVGALDWVERGSGGLVDLYIVPKHNPNLEMYLWNTSLSDHLTETLITTTDITAGSGAPLAIRFNFPKVSSFVGWADSVFMWKPLIDPVSSITRSELMDSLIATDYIGFSWSVESFDSNFKPDLDISFYGGKFAFVSTLGGLSRYTLFIPRESIDSVVSDLYNGNISIYFKFFYRYKQSSAKSLDLYFSNFTLTTNPAGIGMLPDDGADLTVVVDGLENLEVAVNTAVSSGVEQLSSVVVQETTKITDSITEQTDTIINIGSDVDMSVPNRDELTSVQERQEAITNEIYDKINSGDVETVVSQKLSDLNSDSLNRSGFSWVGSLMQKTFDLGFGELIVMCLTLGVALFVIGRRMG